MLSIWYGPKLCCVGIGYKARTKLKALRQSVNLA